MTTSKNKEEISGSFDIYIDKVDFSKPVKVTYNGKVVFDDKVVLNDGVIAESIALFGDPKRIFAAKVTINLK